MILKCYLLEVNVSMSYGFQDYGLLLSWRILFSVSEWHIMETTDFFAI